MNKIVFFLLFVLSMVSMNAAMANEALTQLNHEVEVQVAEIDDKYGVLLTYDERNHLKVSLIVEAVSSEFESLSVVEQQQKAIEVYELTDSAEQRLLLIGLQQARAEKNGNGEGIDPR